MLCLMALIGVLVNVRALPQPAAASYLQKNRSFFSTSEFERATQGKVPLKREARLAIQSGILAGSSHGIALQRSDGSAAPFPPDRILPWNEVTVIALEAPSVYWIGTTRGAIRCDRTQGVTRIEYFAGMRWLPDDHVTGLGVEQAAPGPLVWIETRRGLSRISYEPATLSEKARRFEQRVRPRHVRHGFTAASHLAVPGDLSSNRTVSSDNDGLWTAMYLAAECFRFRVTGDREAGDHARQGIQALMRLESITGIPGFPARSIIEVGKEEQPADGEWHPTSDGRWRWKGDTSSDEIVGHYFAYAVYYDLVADEEEKRQIRAVVERITSHILDNGYHLIDVDGKPTRWGWWAPEEIWADPDETGLRALHLLSHLAVAHRITGIPRYRTAYDELVRKHRYALLTRNQKINIPGHINHSDDELAFLSYYPLLLIEQDPALKAIYVESLERSWQVERPERNPLWNLIYAVGSGARQFDLEESLATLRQIPMDLISWQVSNSHRLDVELDPLADRFRRKQSLVVLPADERPMMKWNGNPYAVDGGSGGRTEDDGAFFLLPYWLGRYHKLIDPSS